MTDNMRLVTAADSLADETSTSPSVSNVTSVSHEPGDTPVSARSVPACDDSPSVDDNTTAFRPSVATGCYETIRMSEPDLSKMPERSALKGSKTRQLKERRHGKENQHEPAALHLSLSTLTTPPHPAAVQFSNTGVLPKAPPKVAPKPRIGP